MRRSLPANVAVQGNLDPVLLNTTPEIVTRETTFRDTLESWKKSEREARQMRGDSPDYYFIPVGFDAIADDSERSFFRSLLTTFTLPDSTVDRLVSAGGTILRDSPEFKRLLTDLKANRSAGER